MIKIFYLSSGECTFTPAINNYHSVSSEIISFEERNRRFMEKMSNIEVLRKEKEENELTDSITGKPLFQPAICRAPKNNVIINLIELFDDKY